MKKYLMVTADIALLSSCSSLLEEDPKSSLLTNQFYSSASELDMATTGLYGLINLSFNQTAGFATTFGADDMTASRNGNKTPFSDFDTFQAGSSNDRMPIWWINFYSTIKSCNALILNYHNASENATETQLNNAAGQIIFPFEKVNSEILVLKKQPNTVSAL